MQIPLVGGGFTEIDEADYTDEVRSMKWRRAIDKRSETRTCYAVFSRVGEMICLHRLIMRATTGQTVDHRDRDGLNNHRDNLRLCTLSQNRANGRQWKQPASGFRGVYASGAKWMACISDNGHRVRYLGAFISKEDAARAYDSAALERWGEFSSLNFQL